MANSIIRAVLETRLKAWADAQVPPIPIAFEGLSFVPPETGPYLRPMLVPNATIEASVAGTHQRMRGLFEVHCWMPGGVGMGPVEQLAQSVISLFPILPKAGVVSIEHTPYTQGAFIDHGWIVMPVCMSYRYEGI